MVSYYDLKEFFQDLDYRLIIAADGEPRTTERKNGSLISKVPAGGVSIAFDPIAKASGAIYVSRGKNDIEKELGSRVKVENGDSYTVKRLFLKEQEMDSYYYGFSNQTLWPLCHIAFEQPVFNLQWYKGYRQVNEKFAKAIKNEIKGKSFIWLNDYQLSLVPKFLDVPKGSIISLFWHIPWPPWEIFRILPFKKEILESLLRCDFLAFHRGYQARNFLNTIDRELAVRIDQETNTIYYNNHKTTITNLPMGIDTDVIESFLPQNENESFSTRAIKYLLGVNIHEEEKESSYDHFFERYKVILGVDRLDYTKGLILRLQALDKFFQDNPKARNKIVYLGILAPSRRQIPAYQKLKQEFNNMAKAINDKYQKENWKPIYVIHEVFQREDIFRFYRKAAVCLVTPRDDGMNLVSKEFVLASSKSKNPGMLVLSKFTGSAIDLGDSLIVNPYDIDEVSSAIKLGLDMNPQEKLKRISRMSKVLEEKNIYEWAENFIKMAISAYNNSSLTEG